MTSTETGSASGHCHLEFLFALLIFAGSFVSIIFRTPSPYVFLIDADAGHQLAGAQQIEFGQHPFIDFRSTYGPLVFYTSYAAQIVGGHTIAAELICCALAYSIAYALLFLAGRQIAGTWPAFVVTLLAIIQFPRFYKYYILLGPALVLIGLYSYIRKPNVPRLACLAIAVAIAGLYRPDQGAYAFLVAAAAVVITQRAYVRAFVTLPAMVFAAASPWLLFLLARGGLKNYLLESTIGAGQSGSGEMALPFPRPSFSHSIFTTENLLSAAFAIWWMVPAVAAVVVYLARKNLDRETRLMAIVTIVFAAISLNQSAHRSDPGHLLQAIVPGYLLVALLARIALDARVIPRAVGMLATIILAVAMTISVWAQIASETLAHPDAATLHNYTYYYCHRPATYVDRLRPVQQYLPTVSLIDYVQSHAAPGQPFLAIPFMNMIYYLSGHPFAGGQMLLAPGYFSTPADQEKLVETLRRQGNPLIIEATNFEFDNRPDRRGRVFAPIFYQYVDQHYQRITGPSLPDGYDALISR